MGFIGLQFEALGPLKRKNPLSSAEPEAKNNQTMPTFNGTP